MRRKPVDTIAPLDVIDGTPQSDLLEGTDAADVLTGLAGDDQLLGGGDTDRLFGDQRSVAADPANGPLALSDDLLLGGNGFDLLYGDTANLDLGMDAGALSVETGDDGLFAGGAGLLFGDANLVTIGGDDPTGAVTLDFGADLLMARKGGLYGDAFEIDFVFIETGRFDITLGDDTILGGDTLVGDSRYVYITYNDFAIGTAALTLAAGNDVLSGGLGDDVIYGDFAELYLSYPGDSSNIVIAGADTIIGGAGDDMLVGDVEHRSFGPQIAFTPGADTFQFHGAFGNDEIADFDAGLDLLRFEGFDGGFDELEMTPGRDGLLVSAAAMGGGTILLAGVTTLSEADVLFV